MNRVLGVVMSQYSCRSRIYDVFCMCSKIELIISSSLCLRQFYTAVVYTKYKSINMMANHS